MAEIEFVPESDDGAAADDELLATGTDRLPRWLPFGGVAAVVALIVGVVVSAHGSHLPPPPPVTSSPLPVQLTTAPTGPPLPLVPIGPSARMPVLGVAVLGRTSWVLQNDGLHVVLPGRPPTHLPVPGVAQTARLTTDPQAQLVWLVTQQRARAFAPDTRLVWDGPVPTFSDIAAMDGRLYLAGGSELVEVGPGTRPRRIFRAPGPLTAVAADPTRRRVVIAYQSGVSQVLALGVRDAGAARIERRASFRTVNITLAVADDALWLAGFATGGDALVRLDQRTLRPIMHFAYEGLLGAGAVLVGAGAGSVWVRDGVGGTELRCVDARSGAQAQVWQLDGLIASTTGRAVLGTGSGAVRLRLDGCRG